MIPPIFVGKTVFIVAGGASLLDFDFSRLDGRPTIAINRALEVMPHAQVLWWSDARFFRHHRAAILAHPAPWKATAHVDYAAEDAAVAAAAGVHTYRFTGLKGFDERPDCLRHGNNSAYAAMHLAVHLGARRLVLLGVDMKHGDGGRSHFHDGHGLLHQETVLTELMLPFFRELEQPLVERGVEVLNASPDSALRVWPRCTIEEGLAL